VAESIRESLQPEPAIDSEDPYEKRSCMDLD
jgi:hypothetical protein